GREELIDADDVRVVELRLDVSLAQEPRLEKILRALREAGVQDGFDDHLARQGEVLSAVNRTHPALRKLAGDFVITDDFSDHRETEFRLRADQAGLISGRRKRAVP